MGSKGNTTENDLLKLIFNATAIANIADNAGTSPLTSLYLSLHSADPGEAGDQITSEVTYTGYARAAVARTSGGFTVSGNQVTLTSAVSFPASSGGGSNATHFAIGTAASGTGKILYYGTLNNTIPCSSAGTTPQLGTGTTITED